MYNTRQTITIYTGLAIIAAAVYWIMPVSGTKIFLQYMAVLSSLILAWTGGLYTLLKYGLRGPKSSTLILLTLGMFSWFVGEVIWTYFENVFHIDPFPSAADLFYLAGYPLFFIGLVHEIRQTHVTWKNLSKSLMFLMVITSILLILLVGYFGVYLAYSPEETILTNTITISYGIADMVLILTTMALLVLAWEFRGGALSKIWLSLFISFLFTLVADILFAIFTSTYDVATSFHRSLTDSIWIISYLLFAFAMFEFGNSVQSANNRLKSLIANKNSKRTSS